MPRFGPRSRVLSGIRGIDRQKSGGPVSVGGFFTVPVPVNTSRSELEGGTKGRRIARRSHAIRWRIAWGDPWKPMPLDVASHDLEGRTVPVSYTHLTLPTNREV